MSTMICGNNGHLTVYGKNAQTKNIHWGRTCKLDAFKTLGAQFKFNSSVLMVHIVSQPQTINLKNSVGT